MTPSCLPAGKLRGGGGWLTRAWQRATPSQARIQPWVNAHGRPRMPGWKDGEDGFLDSYYVGKMTEYHLRERCQRNRSSL